MAGDAQADSQTTVYDAVGGAVFFERLVDEFYRRVEKDAELLALYPDTSDLVGARRRLTMFLVQYWGGPTTYSDERGHPRLRMRHAPFAIDSAARDRWLGAMRGALDELAPDPAIRFRFDSYFDMAAEGMINT